MTDEKTGRTNDKTGNAFYFIVACAVAAGFMLSEMMRDNNLVQKLLHPETTQAETNQPAPPAKEPSCVWEAQLVDSHEGKKASLAAFEGFWNAQDSATIRGAKMVSMHETPDRENWFMPDMERATDVYKDKDTILNLGRNLERSHRLLVQLVVNSIQYEFVLTRLQGNDYRLKTYVYERECE